MRRPEQLRRPTWEERSKSLSPRARRVPRAARPAAVASVAADKRSRLRSRDSHVDNRARGVATRGRRSRVDTVIKTAQFVSSSLRRRLHHRLRRRRHRPNFFDYDGLTTDLAHFTYRFSTHATPPAARLASTRRTARPSRHASPHCTVLRGLE